MCDFPSWIKDSNGKVHFLTDKEVNQRLRVKPHLEVYDCIGHGAIESHLGVYGDHIEGFDRLPASFAKAIQAGKCNKMMKAVGIKALKFNAKGKLHCVDGPAVISEDQDQYFLNGVEQNYDWSVEAIKLLKGLKVKITEASLKLVDKAFNNAC